MVPRPSELEGSRARQYVELVMHRRCTALTRGGGRCERPSAPNHWRCHLHGAGSRGPRYLTAEAIAARVARMQAGRGRWVQRMRLAKQEGLIERFPNGRRARGAAKLHPDRTIRRAQKIIEARMAKDASLRVVPDDPSVDDTALEPRAAPLEHDKAATRPPSRAKRFERCNDGGELRRGCGAARGARGRAA